MDSFRGEIYTAVAREKNLDCAQVELLGRSDSRFCLEKTCCSRALSAPEKKYVQSFEEALVGEW
jgi:hypothetical protein